MVNRLVVLAVTAASAAFAVGAAIVYERATRVAPDPPSPVEREPPRYVRELPAFIEAAEYVSAPPVGCRAPPGSLCVEGVVFVDPEVAQQIDLPVGTVRGVARRLPDNVDEALTDELVWMEDCDDSGEERIYVEAEGDDAAEDDSEVEAAADPDSLEEIPFQVAPDGRFRVFLEPGRYDLRMIATNIPLEAFARVDLTDVKGQDVNLELPLHHLQWLTGSVVDERYGVPLGGGKVAVQMDSPLYQRECVQVLPDGTFATLAPSQLGGTLVFKHPGHRPKRVHFTPNQDTLRVGLSRSALYVGRLGERLQSHCGIGHVLVEGTSRTEGRVNDRYSQVSDDCTFQLEGLTVPGLRRLSLVSDTGDAAEALVDVPAQGDPAPVCLGGPCAEAAALLVVQLAFDDSDDQPLRTIEVDDLRRGLWTTEAGGHEAVVTAASSAGTEVTVTVIEGDDVEEAPRRRRHSSAPRTVSRRVRLHPGINELLVGR